MIELSYYEVYDVYSEDGRGPITIIGRFTNESDATGYAKGRGNYNSNARVKPASIAIVESLDEAEDFDKIKKRNAALAKLTPAERVLLGLDA
jgi:hypothetical protein